MTGQALQPPAPLSPMGKGKVFSLQRGQASRAYWIAYLGFCGELVREGTPIPRRSPKSMHVLPEPCGLRPAPLSHQEGKVAFLKCLLELILSNNPRSFLLFTRKGISLCQPKICHFSIKIIWS